MMLRILLLVFALNFGVMPCFAGQRCDPTKPGFFKQINCAAEYDQREVRRIQLLSNLDREYKQLMSQNSSIRFAIEANATSIERLEADLLRSQKRIEAIRAAGLDPARLDWDLGALVKEAEFVSNAIDTTLLIESGCREEVFRERRVELIKRKSAVDESLGWVGGIVVGEIASESTKALLFPDKEKDKLARTLIDVISMGLTLYDGAKRIDRYNNDPREKVTYVEQLRANCS